MSPTARPTVAIDVTPLLGARSGIGAAVSEIITALRALEAGPDLVPYTLSTRARLHRESVPTDTRFVPIPARILLRSWARRDTPRIDRWLRPARVVHATNYLTPPSRLPTLISVYDCSFVRYPELCTPEVRAFDPIIRRAVARGATLHTGSEFVAGEIEEIYGPGLRAAGRLVVIPLGIPALGDRAEMPETVACALGGAPFVVAIGTLEPRKNFAHLVGAFGQVATRHPDVRLVIAGHDGPARPEIDAAIARLGVGVRERVVVAGPVSDAGRRALLEQASLLAYPSIYEGFGFPVLEAMTAGVPVVAARAGSIPEVAGDAALLVEPTNEGALADEMDRVLTDDATRAELVARGRDRVHAFSWDHTARALASCYRRIAESHA
ncbi:MAG TPA: glycosyltransferase family 1 protein [Acidimicrobiia bacterium]|nr:glycosyltransferase family 1 protein [Acidimicrobiia bacterium]